MPSTEQILNSALARSTHSAYATYIRQFEEYIIANELQQSNTTEQQIDNCVNFLHHLSEKGLKTNTVSQAKSSLVYLFSEVSPNPAKNKKVKKYIKGLRKYRKVNNLEDEIKAHPLNGFELNELLNSLDNEHPFVRLYFRLLLQLAFIGCFRIGELLELRINDISIRQDEDGDRYLSIRLRWFKHSNEEDGSQVYHIYNELNVEHLDVVDSYVSYIQYIQSMRENRSDVSVLFCNYTFNSSGILELIPTAKVIQNY